MILLKWSENEAEAFLRAMHTVASQGGTVPLEDIDLEVLDSTARHILHRDLDPAGLAPISGQELARAIPEPERRLQALEFALLMPYVPGELHPGRVKTADILADALGIHPKEQSQLHQVRDGHLKRLLFDHARKTLHDYMPGDTTAQRLRSLIGYSLDHLGDDEVANRYRRLGDLQEDTLGYALLRFWRDRGFQVPGEQGGFGDFLVPHDASHLISGLNTDLPGEIGLAAFEAGMCRSEFAYQILIVVILEFHLGIRLYYPPQEGGLDPEQMTVGLELGAQMNRDLCKNWDWWADLETPLPELRSRFGLPPNEQIVLAPPPPHDAV